MCFLNNHLVPFLVQAHRLLLSRKRRTEGKAALHLVTVTVVALAACTELATSFEAASKMLCINNLGRFPD